DTTKIYSHFALLYAKWGRYTDAIRVAGEAIAAFQVDPGPGSEEEALTRLSRAGAYLMTNRLEEAEAETDQAYQWLKDRLGPDHLSAVRALHDLAAIYWRLGRYQKAASMGEEALAALTRRGSGETTDAAVLLVNIGNAYVAL